MKGQGSTEYLVILAVVLVVALIVIGLLGQFTEFGSSGLEQQSNSYWQSQSPFSIMNKKINSSEVRLEVQNKLFQRLNLTSLKFGDTVAAAVDINATNDGAGVMFASGETKTLVSNGYTPSCTATGEVYQINTVIFTYNSPGLSGQTQIGGKPLYGKCS